MQQLPVGYLVAAVDMRAIVERKVKMKTKLKINKEFEKYLYKFEDKTEKETNKEVCKILEVDTFNCHWVFKFENNYGASVIKHWGSYGFENDLFELAVLEYDEDDLNKYHLTYDTPITDDVCGHLTNKEVMELLERIRGL